MLIQIIHSTITLMIIFTTIYCCGLSVLKKIKFEGEQDFFLRILAGYIFIGVVSLIFHFFFKINNFFSLSLVLVSLIFFLIFFFKDYKKEFFAFILIFISISPFLFAYSDHPIDSNMYHHPYLSYLKTEKIIFAVANIQFRFGHTSLLQYVQAALINDYFHNIALSSINILFYLSFIFFVSQKIFFQKSISYSFLLTILVSSFILIKFARYREYGNDLIPLLICLYFLIRIVDEFHKKTKFSENAPNLFLFLFALMFVHKISYIFASLIFITLIDFKKFKFLRYIKLSYILFTFLLLFPWLIKSYIETSCFAYPIEITCFSNSYYNLYGKADPSSAAWLTEIWAKGFIDHPEWRSLNLQNYSKEFNWVPIWLSGHFIKILEIIAPLLFLICLGSLYMLINKKKNKDRLDNKSKKYLILLLSIFCGLFIWFYKAPVFRYGSFYIISFITIGYLLILNSFFKLKKSLNVIFFKRIFIICIIFFISKNITRIHNSSNDFFPKTINTELNIKNINGLNLSRSKSKLSSLCYYTTAICSHELPSSIKVRKLKNYYVIE